MDTATLEMVVAWLKFRRDEHRSGDMLVFDTIDNLLDEARDALATDGRLPFSISEDH